jgi:hypothetical protein
MHIIHEQTNIAKVHDHKKLKILKMQKANKPTSANHPASPRPAEL